MKVYVMTKFKPFGKEEYVGVKKSQKEAVKALRQLFPPYERRYRKRFFGRCNQRTSF